MSYAQKYSIFFKTILKKDNAAVSYRNERIARTSADKIEPFNAVHYWAEHILTVAIYPWECSHSWISVVLWVTSYVVFIDYIKGRHFVVILSITDIGHSWNEMQCPCYIIPYVFSRALHTISHVHLVLFAKVHALSPDVGFVWIRLLPIVENF